MSTQRAKPEIARRCGRTARGNRSEATGKFSVRARAATALAEAGSMRERWRVESHRVKRVSNSLLLVPYEPDQEVYGVAPAEPGSRGGGGGRTAAHATGNREDVAAHGPGERSADSRRARPEGSPLAEGGARGRAARLGAPDLRQRRPGLQALPGGLARWKLQRSPGTTARRGPPGPELRSHLHDLVRPVQEDDVDREPHERGVDGSCRPE